MLLAHPSRALLRDFGRRAAREAEVYAELGFPEGYTTGDWQTQCVLYDHPTEDCQLLLT